MKYIDSTLLSLPDRATVWVCAIVKSSGKTSTKLIRNLSPRPAYLLHNIERSGYDNYKIYGEGINCERFRASDYAIFDNRTECIDHYNHAIDKLIETYTDIIEFVNRTIVRLDQSKVRS
jgi:hypothetical protein